MTSLRIGSLCSGYGGLDLSVMDVLGATVAWHAQHDPDDRHQYAAQILAHHWPAVPNLGDITAIDWADAEPVDILTAGFPCQDLSLAGRRAGLREGNRSGLWFHVARAIETLRPSLVVIENVPGILSSAADGDMEPCPCCVGDADGVPALRALGAVLADLARLGLDAEWTSMGANEVGAPHRRRRVFLIAWPADAEGPRGGATAHPEGVREREPTDEAHPVTGGWDARQEPRRRGLLAPAHPAGLGHGHAGEASKRGVPAAPVAGGPPAAADTDRFEPKRRGRPRELGGPAPAEQSEGNQRERAGSATECRGPDAPELDWGPYGPAIARWEHVMGRPAPAPTEPGRNGPRLAAPFVEWMMGAPEGWITGVPGIPRTAQLKAAGNGVVRQQGAAALRYLLAQAHAELS